MNAAARRTALLKSTASSARRFPSPENYFSGRRWQHTFLPDNILCFHRSRPVHELGGHEGISQVSGKYDQHDRFVLILCLREGGTVGVETNLFSLEEGDALLIFPHQLHYYLDLPDRFCWFYSTFELPVEAHESVAALRDRPHRLNDAALDHLRSAMKSYRSSPDAQALETALALRSLLIALREEGPSPAYPPDGESTSGDDSDDHLVRDIKRHIYGQLEGDLSLATIAAHMGLSESYLRARFKDSMGISLWQFVLAVRVTRAAHLLKTSSKKIADISKACGFDSQPSFTRAFKRAFAITPRHYRNRET